MKKNYYSLLLVATTALTLAACGNSTKNNAGDKDSIISDSANVSESMEVIESRLTLKPKTDRIQGELGFCFDVVNKSYELTENDGYNAILSVEVQRNNNSIMFNPALATTFDDEGGIAVAFGIQVVDENGVIIHEDIAGEIGHGSPAYPEDAVEVVNLKEGKSGTLRFAITNVDKINNKCSFSITSAFKEL